MQFSSDQSLSGLSIATPLGQLLQQNGVGSMVEASKKMDRTIIMLGSMVAAPLGEVKKESNDVPSNIVLGEKKRDSPTPSVASMESLDWEESLYSSSYTHLDKHPIQEVILSQEATSLSAEDSPTTLDMEHVAAYQQVCDRGHGWMDHLVALIGTLLFCAFLYVSRWVNMEI